LVPKQIKANGLKPELITISKKAAIYTVTNRYTREAGVRNLEREISAICRKVARQVVKEDDAQAGQDYRLVHQQVARSAAVQKHRSRKGSDRPGDRAGLDAGGRRTAVSWKP
jgi:ATP-dependent Lon protease